MDHQFAVKDQVVIRRRLRTFAKTSEVKVGTILCFQDSAGKSAPDGDFAVVSTSQPGGRSLRQVLPVSELQPVSEQFKRASVQINPAFRAIAGYRPM